MLLLSAIGAALAADVSPANAVNARADKVSFLIDIPPKVGLI
jgi:hypothetical protein